MGITITIIVLVFGMWLYVRVRRNQKSENMLAEIKTFSDNELTNHEKNISDSLFQMFNAIRNDLNYYYDNKVDFDKAIKEVALEVFKSGLWRIGDKEIANHYFRNYKYIDVNCDKFIYAIDLMAQSGTLFYKSSKEIDKLILEWVIKFRDDTKANYGFFNG